MNKIAWRHQYDWKRDAEERALSDIDCKDESLAQQQYKDETDLNVLLGRYGITELPPVPAVDPRFYGDLSDVPDLRTMLEIRERAMWDFNALPTKLRARFGNDPAQLWEFVNDPDNVDEAVKLGLLKREGGEPPPPPPDPVTSSASPPTSGVA